MTFGQPSKTNTQTDCFISIIIRESIEKRASAVKKCIIRAAKTKILSLMIDIATRYNRAVLGISICYMDEGKIVIRSIGMTPLHFSHMAENIFNMIKQKLLEYEISLDQVISATSDNGKNIVKAVTKLDDNYQQYLANDLIDNDEYIDPEIFDETYYDNILDQVRSSFNGVAYTNMIHGISCGAHCLHLVVTHAITRTEEINLLVSKCRRLVKKLRTPTMRAVIGGAGNNMAIIDVETRWNSIFSMVSSFAKIILLQLYNHIYFFSSM